MKRKIINDPLYGFVSVENPLIFQVISHPWFQRLRHIRQLGMADMVYPGASHTRFQHALGAYHLMGKALDSLRNKGVSISEEEREAVLLAILLHDIGHGPLSHALEETLMPGVHHESITYRFLISLNEQFAGKLSLALKIFRDGYERRFFHQLVSGQIDIDRLDYLERDSFFTGVREGIIGVDRIIDMLNVHRDQLVVEEKAVYSLENFITARRLMYWQVYLHKTAISAERMMVNLIKRAQWLARAGHVPPCSAALRTFLEHQVTLEDFSHHRHVWIVSSELYQYINKKHTIPKVVETSDSFKSSFDDLFHIRDLYVISNTLGTNNSMIIYGEWGIPKKIPINAGYDEMVYDQTVLGLDYLDCSTQA
ncbi:MAG: HD domain-containing protein, partial [Bacteroidota bacterium]